MFKDVLVPDMKQRSPPDTVKTDPQKIDLLEKFNYAWQDWTYRDIIEVEERYSDLQKQYFATLPKNRLQLIEKILQGEEVNDSGASLDQGHVIT